MNLVDFDLKDIWDEYECLAFPILYYRDHLSVLVKSNGNDGPHVFGGELPMTSNCPDGAHLHLLMNIDTRNCPVFENEQLTNLPLLFPFRHNGGRMKYTCSADEILVNEIDPPTISANWPYSNYPDEFPRSTLNSSKPIKITPEELEELLPQGLSQSFENSAVVIIPPRADYGVSLWGEDGDAEMVQCVFVYQPDTGLVVAENQCT